MTATTTYCVCARESDRDAFEPVETGLADLAAAEGWLRANYQRFPDYCTWYLDREENDGTAEAYYDVRDGELVWTN